ncbi:siderophore-iron reductase FhuF [Brevibacillus migulae]|uniref:siderophore-iron reductase FhuF n=1 Tax=Brevibacillus migulae TaxID=1644114 RepID=UPI00106E7DDF|nr:siderophore-iron reductase FhuF [Brevibacillus migulae]
MVSTVPLALLEDLFRIRTSVPTAASQCEAIQLLDEEKGKAFLEEVGATLKSPSPAVTASIFVKRYLALVMGAFYSMTMHSYGLNIALENVVLTSENKWSKPEFSLKDPEGLGPLTGDRGAWREKIVRHISNENLQPLISALSAHSKVSPNVLWSHAAYLIHHYYAEWQKEAQSEELKRQIEEDFLYVKQIDDAMLFGSCEKNPISTQFIEIAHPAKPGEIVRLRKHCCMAYRLPEGKCCYTCPKLDEEERIAQILERGK